jgi:hypothetical protein
MIPTDHCAAPWWWVSARLLALGCRPNAKNYPFCVASSWHHFTRTHAPVTGWRGGPLMSDNGDQCCWWWWLCGVDRHCCQRDTFFMPPTPAPPPVVANFTYSKMGDIYKRAALRKSNNKLARGRRLWSATTAYQRLPFVSASELKAINRSRRAQVPAGHHRRHRHLSYWKQIIFVSVRSCSSGASASASGERKTRRGGGFEAMAAKVPNQLWPLRRAPVVVHVCRTGGGRQQRGRTTFCLT